MIIIFSSYLIICAHVNIIFLTVFYFRGEEVSKEFKTKGNNIHNMMSKCVLCQFIIRAAVVFVVKTALSELNGKYWEFIVYFIFVFITAMVIQCDNKQ